MYPRLRRMDTCVCPLFRQKPATSRYMYIPPLIPTVCPVM